MVITRLVESPPQCHNAATLNPVILETRKFSFTKISHFLILFSKSVFFSLKKEQSLSRLIFTGSWKISLFSFFCNSTMRLIRERLMHQNGSHGKLSHIFLKCPTMGIMNQYLPLTHEGILLLHKITTHAIFLITLLDFHTELGAVRPASTPVSKDLSIHLLG